MRLDKPDLMLIVLACLINCKYSEASLFSWLFGTSRKADLVKRQSGSADSQAAVLLAVRKAVPFEMETTDAKFLASAQLSPLDTCHHMMVAEIRGTCAELAEEEMGKLAVHLLNCQSKAEGRPTFTCTTDMTLGECTRDMDGTTWNAYQIVANRALAVCHATRQRHFRLHAQHAVDELVHSAHAQAHNMRQLQTSQEELAATTADTLHRVHSGQQQLLGHQVALQSAQSTAHAQIAGNIRDLTRERALIASGNRELASMTDDIRKKLDTATEQISGQEREQRANHKQILDDLLSIRDRAEKVWRKIDESSARVMRAQRHTQAQYRATLKGLRHVNRTVDAIVGAIRSAESLLASRGRALAALVGGTGDRVAALCTAVAHVGYLVVAAVAAAFLRASTASRVAVLVLVPLDAWAEVVHGRGLGYAGMTALIGSVIVLNWLMSWLTTTDCSQRQAVPAAITYSVVSPATENSDSAVDDVDTADEKAGNADIKQLVHILNKLYRTGALTPAVTRDAMKHDVTSPADISHHLADFYPSPQSTPLDPPPTPVAPGMEQSFVESVHSIREVHVDDVKRHLMGYLESESLRNVSPAPSYTSTPNRSRLRRSDSSRDSSFCRHPCLATTKQGLPCRLASMDGSAFCHRHRV